LGRESTRDGGKDGAGLRLALAEAAAGTHTANPSAWLRARDQARATRPLALRATDRERQELRSRAGRATATRSARALARAGDGRVRRAVRPSGGQAPRKPQ